MQMFGSLICAQIGFSDGVNPSHCSAFLAYAKDAHHTICWHANCSP